MRVSELDSGQAVFTKRLAADGAKQKRSFKPMNLGKHKSASNFELPPKCFCLSVSLLFNGVESPVVYKCKVIDRVACDLELAPTGHLGEECQIGIIPPEAYNVLRFYAEITGALNKPIIIAQTRAAKR